MISVGIYAHITVYIGYIKMTKSCVGVQMTPIYLVAKRVTSGGYTKAANTPVVMDIKEAVI